VLTIAASVPGVIGTLVVIILGNLIVIVLEGLVVSIQTSRLVLFEFFVRFFEGSGRAFGPAAQPPSARSESKERGS
jgi:V/A-type H+-transporting ATPase subunit I